MYLQQRKSSGYLASPFIKGLWVWKLTSVWKCDCCSFYSLGSISHHQRSRVSKHSGYTRLHAHHNTGTPLSLAVKHATWFLPLRNPTTTKDTRGISTVTSPSGRPSPQRRMCTGSLSKRGCCSSETQIGWPFPSARNRTRSRQTQGSRLLMPLASTQMVNPIPQGPAPFQSMST